MVGAASDEGRPALGLLVRGPGTDWWGSVVTDLLLTLLQPHPSPWSRSGEEEVTLANKQGGGWCAPRRGAEGVPRAPPVIYGQEDAELWPLGAVCSVSSPGCYWHGLLIGVAREEGHHLTIAPVTGPAPRVPMGIQPSLGVPRMLL